MELERGSVEAIEKVVKLGLRIKPAEMAEIADLVEHAGGELVGVEPDDQECDTGRLLLKWPPKKPEFVNLVEYMVRARINFEVLINGIPAPRELMIKVTRKPVYR